MILSDRSIREALDAKRIVIDPLDPRDVQPSSVDLHIDRYFRVFRNDTTPYIDPKEPQEDLTEIVEVKDGEAFILHPGEFVLGSTLERVALPDDLVARLEGKSSLGRLGLLIHSSLPASETVLVRDEDGVLAPRPIGEVVAKRTPAWVVSFDPETFAVDYHRITGWYEGPADRIFEVRLASGRAVRVTAGHNLFTLDREGALTKVRTGELSPGTMVAIPRRIPDPADAPHAIRIVDLMPESARPMFTVSGPSVRRLFADEAPLVRSLLVDGGWGHTDYYARIGRLPVTVAALVPGLLESLGPDDRIGVKGGRHELPAVLRVDAEIAWLLGLYVAEGSRRRNQLTLSNTDQEILDRVEAALTRWGLPSSRAANAVTCCSSVASELLAWLGTGEHAHGKRVPPIVFGWPAALIEHFIEGLVDGDGSRQDFRTSVWTCSDGLVADLLLLAPRLGLRAGVSTRTRKKSLLHQVYFSHREHKLLTSLPEEGAATGDLLWDRVVEVVDTGSVEPIYDIEVRPGGAKIENFVAGSGGVFVSNTAGFVDAGWDGHLTLELSNVATLPIALYPGMKIGQISFFQMTTAAEHPYGSEVKGSKYQGQRGPTPSRYYLNFSEDEG